MNITCEFSYCILFIILLSACRNRKLNDDESCPSCSSSPTIPLKWGNADITVELPSGSKRLTVWKPELITLFDIPNFSELTSLTLEDLIADQLPPSGDVKGKVILHNDKVMKIIHKRPPTD